MTHLNNNISSPEKHDRVSSSMEVFVEHWRKRLEQNGVPPSLTFCFQEVCDAIEEKVDGQWKFVVGDRDDVFFERKMDGKHIRSASIPVELFYMAIEGHLTSEFNEMLAEEIASHF